MLEHTHNSVVRLVALVALVLLPGCCFIGCEEDALMVPAARIEVTDPDGRPVPNATVTIARYVEHPHFNPQQTFESAADVSGTARFEHRIGTVKQYPLMMHGVAGYAWQVCAEAPGYRTRVEPLFGQGEPWESTSWPAIEKGETVELKLELSKGPSDPCSEAVEYEPLKSDRLTCVSNADCVYMTLGADCCPACYPALVNAATDREQRSKCEGSEPADCTPCESSERPPGRCLAGMCRRSSR